MSKTNHPESLHKATHGLLHKAPLSLLDIHKQSGVPFYWLKKFSAGEIKDPSVNTVQRLYEFLSKQKLHV